MAFDIYAEITDRIIAEMEKGIIPWTKPWVGTGGAISYESGRPYSLLNQILLGKPGEYLTFNQVQKNGGKVKKGAKSKFVVFWKFIEKAQADKDGNMVKDSNGLPIMKSIPFLKYYNVFHIEDCEGIEPKHTKDLSENKFTPIEKAEKVLNEYIAREHIDLIFEAGDRAFYRPSTDEIHLPTKEQFITSEGFYETAFHESVHSTGHPKRLNRIAIGAGAAGFGSEDYGKEELVAEIGSCAILNQLGIETEKSFRNNASYIQNWLQALKNDKRMIVSAAGKAEKAVEMIFNIEKKSKGKAD